MLEVYSVPFDGQRISYMSYTTSSTVVPGAPPMGFIFIRRYPGICSQLKGVISDGGKDAFNNRSCSHVELSGNIFPVDSNGVNHKILQGIHDSTPYEYNLYRIGSHVATNLLIGGLSNINLTYPDWTRWGLSIKDISYRVTLRDPYTAECVLSWRQGSSRPLSNVNFVQIHENEDKFRTSGDGYSWSRWIPFQQSEPLSITHLDIPDLQTIYNVVHEIGTFQSNGDNMILSDLVRRAADDASFTDINSIEFLRDLPRIFDEVSVLKDIFLKKKVSPSDIASLYLSLKYGTKLTVADSNQYIEDVRRSLWRSLNGFKQARAAERLHSITKLGIIYTDYHYKIYYDKADSTWKQIVSGLLSCGLFPTPKSSWELFPYSFAVDWLFPVSDYLSQSDAALKWATYSIKGSVYSTKKYMNNFNPYLLESLRGYIGNISAKSYTRIARVSDTLDHRPVYASTSPGTSFSNYAEMSALIVQRLH